MTLTLMCEPV
ncbi:hypothetical protein F383_17681 [Gossypium arboreum]|uniref:Uncharacterized protein n=1 Tax=Gossypium arboreum TaxID=29729 RepID=A0A0B0NP16_GOSAR|nr:hypothetical protein F383_17681 [Gossypium arboreum]